MNIDKKTAIKKISAGEVIGIPTDTVYGLAASICFPEAIKRLFTIKGRPLSKPMVVQIPSYHEAQSFLKNDIPQFEKLAQKFWPGALTLVVPIDEKKVPSVVRAGLPCCGFRVPQHKMALELLEASGALVVPSANLSSQEPALSPQQIEEIFGECFPILDGGICSSSIPSTVLCYEEKGWKILRHGAVSQKEIKSILGENLK